MISEDKIQQWEKNQQQQVQQVAIEIKKRGHISRASDFYPDIQFKQSIGYRRGEVPIKALMLLYEQVVVRVPSLKTKKQLEAFLGMSFDEFISAIQEKSIIPIIDNINDCRYDHYDQLIDEKPPVLFSRGVALLNHVNLEMVLDEGRKAIHDNKISINNQVKKELEGESFIKKAKNVEAAIESDLAILYADLYLFGHKQCIDDIFYKAEPYEMYKNLKVANKIFTYPILFGMGGTANFESIEAAHAQIPLFSGVGSIPTRKYQIISKNLSNLLAFFDIATTKLSIKEIITFQQQGGCKKIQVALKKLEESVKGRLEATGNMADSIVLLEELETAIRELYSKLDKKLLDIIEKKAKLDVAILSFTAGFIPGVGLALGLGALLASLSEVRPSIASFLGQNKISWLKGDKIADIVNKALIAKELGPTVASIWDARQVMNKAKIINKVKNDQK